MANITPEWMGLIRLGTIILLPIIPAFLLFAVLPSRADVSGPLQGMEVKLGGAFAGYFALVVLLLSLYNQVLFPKPPTFEVWEVTGKLTDKDGKDVELLKKDEIELSRPFLILPGGGNFKMTFITSPSPGGGVEFPMLSVHHPPFAEVTIPLDNNKYSYGDWTVTLKTEKKQAITMTPIRLIELGNYSGAGMPPSPVTEPALANKPATVPANH